LTPEPSHTTATWPIDVTGHPLTLPIVPIKPDFAIALMMIIDCGVGFGAHVGARLADRFRAAQPDIVVGSATLGIPVAIETTRALGLDRYVVLQKSPKIHLGDALVETITSITSKGAQRLMLDRQAIPLLQGRRVLVVDDVIATGASLKGALRLVRAAGAEVVGIGCVLTEAHDWRAALGADAALVQGLAHIPQFSPGPDGWAPIAATL
jgi:adenine/guanine phosphoribosyltransferase-like PRPP-binding protein